MKILATLLLLLLLGACSRRDVPVRPILRPAAERHMSTPFRLHGTDALVDLESYRGQVVLLNFWATWCLPCKAEIPWFVEFQKQYASRGFTVLGVTLDEEGWSVVLPYARKRNVNYPLALASYEVMQAYGGIDNIPTTFLLDRKGRIAATKIGLVEKLDYQMSLEMLLAEKP